MCFSAPVSLGASAVLLVSGAYAVRHARQLPAAWTPWALIPVLFGVQQAFEGGVWLSFTAENPRLALVFAIGFHFFSHFLWPWWIALSSYLVEPGKISRRIFAGCAMFGAFAGTLVYAAMLMHPEWMSVRTREHAIVYDFSIPYRSDIHLPVTPLMLYGFIILVPLLFSSHKLIRIFGILLVVSMALSSAVNNAAFVSVWCFFAALLSLYISYMIRSQMTLPGAKLSTTNA